MKRSQILPEFNRRLFLEGAAGVAGTVVAGGLAKAADGGRNPFAYDVEKYRQTDPRLVGYERVARFAVPVPDSRRLAMGPGDRLYLASGASIRVLDLHGVPLSEVACGGPVRAVAVAGDGVIYAGLRDRVEVYDAKGRRLAQWDPPPGRPFITGLAAGSNDVFVADSGNRVVYRHDRSGALRGRIGEKDRERNIPGLILPSPFLDVEIAPDGLLRVNNPGRHRVEVYTFGGDLELAWGKPSMAIEGFCGCCNPVNLALLKDGRCVTFEKGLPRVKVYGVDGTFECVVAGTETFADTRKEPAITDADERGYGGLDGVVDSQGRIYVLDLLGAEVQVMQARKERVS